MTAEHASACARVADAVLPAVTLRARSPLYDPSSLSG